MSSRVTTAQTPAVQSFGNAQPLVLAVGQLPAGQAPFAIRSVFKVEASQSDTFLRAAAQLAAFVNGKESPVLFRFFQDAEQPGQVTLFEEWDGKDAFARSRAARHTQQFLQQTGLMLQEPIRVSLYRRASEATAGDGTVDHRLADAQPPARPTAARTAERLAQAGMAGQPFTLFVDVPVKKGGAALLKDTAVRVQTATLPEAGSIRYGYFQNLADPSLFLLFEWWDSFDAMAAHVELPHFQQLMKTFGAVGGAGRSVAIGKPLKF